MPFHEFLNIVCSIRDEDCDVHFRSQTSFLFDENNSKMDFVGKIENIHDDWNFVCQRIGINTGILNLKRSRHAPWLSYYDKNMYTMLVKRYIEDYELLHYDKNYVF